MLIWYLLTMENKEPLPLVQKSNIEENHDVSHVFREVFQDVLHTHVFPRNVIENAEKYGICEEAHFKDSAKVITAIYANDSIAKNEIITVEKDVMYKQAVAIINEDIIKKDEILSEAIRLKRFDVMQDLKNDDIKKYSLLNKADMLPTEPVRSMNFCLNSNEHACKLPCPSELDLIPSKIDKPVNAERKTWKIPKIMNLNIPVFNRKRKMNFEQEANKVTFKPYPRTVVFDDYELNVTYEQTFKLRNVTKQAQSFMLRKLPKPCFMVEQVSGLTRIAPGMHALFRVKYRTDIYLDIEDTVTFTSCMGNDVNVNLVSYRRPPVLRVYMFKNTDKFSINCVETASVESFDDARASALNYTFDCGNCLLGNRNKLSLIVKNEGSNADFFFITEEEWYSDSVNSVNEHMELSTEEFEIYPSYFRIQEDEFVEISLTFFPVYYGLHIEKLFLMCNNNTYEEIEIIGDGILFEQDFIRIEVPLKNGSLSYMDEESDRYLYMEPCLPYTRQKCIITVHNISCLNFRFHWDIRKSTTTAKISKLRQMDESWVKIQHECCILPSDSTTDFEINVTANSRDAGLYSIVLGFYIEDIPEASLAEGHDFRVIEKSQQTDDVLHPALVDILVSEIEIACNIVPVHILIEPAEMVFLSPLSYKEVIIKKIQLRTNDNFLLHCKWNNKNSQHCIKMEPAEFTLVPGETFICEIMIYPETYADIHKTLTLSVKEGIYEKKYNVIAKVKKPEIKFSTNILDFGDVLRGTTVEKSFFVESYSYDKITWKIMEFTYDFVKKCLQEVQTLCLSDTSGILARKGDKAKVNYLIQGNECHRWLSFLMLVKSHETETMVDSFMLVTYNVCVPKITVHTSMSNSPILCPSSLIYLGVCSFYTLCMHNTGNVAAHFLCGDCVGDQANYLDIQISPRAGMIKPHDFVKISVSLVPLQTGLIEHVYLPCFIAKMEEPLVVTIMCAVDNVHLKILLPNSDGHYTEVLWPPNVIDEYNMQSIEDYDAENVEEKNYHLEELFKVGSQNNTINSDEHLDNVPYEYSEQTPSSISMTTSEKTTVEADISTLRHHFDSDLNLEEHFIEVHGVQIHTPVKKTFVIKNITPINCTCCTEVTNFESVEPERNKFEELLVHMGYKNSDKWEKQILPGIGIVVKVNPMYAYIEGHGALEIDLWIYANTWGIYLEEVVVEVNDIQPFCFSMLIQVMGLPIEYPIARNTIHNEPVLRFGSIPYQSDPVLRKLKVKNISSIKVSVVWRMFFLNTSSDNENPLNLSEIASDATLEPNDAYVENKWCGKEIDDDVFKIEPRELEINPLSTSTLTLIFDSSCVEMDFPVTKIQALLLGFIHLREDLKKQSNYYVRHTGYELDPTTVNISLMLDMPLLRLELVEGDLQIKDDVSNIIRNRIMHHDIKLLFKNVSAVTGEYSMHINSPFNLMCIKALGVVGKSTIVKPGGCIEVYVQCQIDPNELLEMSKALQSDISHSDFSIDKSTYSIEIQRNLNIHQKGVKEQSIPLKIVLFYPRLTVSARNVVFGNAYIGNTKKSTISIRNKTCGVVEFRIHQESTSKNFLIVPSSGLLPRSNGVYPQEISVIIEFVPTESKLYMETIQVITQLTNEVTEVHLNGVGTYNEKFYCEGF